MSEQRDIPLLVFLWQWKLSTTAALACRFFPERSLPTAYHRLWLLEKAKFIREHTDRYRKRFAWGLDQKGYHAIRELLPALREEGYKSENIGHDLLVTAVHIGDWLLGAPTGAEVFSEQQLRRYHSDYFPA